MLENAVHLKTCTEVINYGVHSYTVLGVPSHHKVVRSLKVTSLEIDIEKSLARSSKLAEEVEELKGAKRELKRAMQELMVEETKKIFLIESLRLEVESMKLEVASLTTKFKRHEAYIKDLELAANK
jgi:chromosome segregation ATPase